MLLGLGTSKRKKICVDEKQNALNIYLSDIYLLSDSYQNYLDMALQQRGYFVLFHFHTLLLSYPNIFSGAAPDVSVHINGSIDVGLLGIIELNTVGVAIIPQFHDCSIGVLTHIGLDLISYLEAELIGDETCFEALRTRSVSELGIN
jgi:hypothetical protein